MSHQSPSDVTRWASFEQERLRRSIRVIEEHQAMLTFCRRVSRETRSAAIKKHADALIDRVTAP